MSQAYCLECGLMGPFLPEALPCWFCPDHEHLADDLSWWSARVEHLRRDRADVWALLCQAEEQILLRMSEEEAHAGQFVIKRSDWPKLNIRRTANYLQAYHPDLYHKLTTVQSTVQIERR